MRPDPESPPSQDVIGAALRAVLGPLVREAVADALAEHAEGAAPKPELLTIDQICAALQVSRATLHRLRDEGLPELRIGDSPRFRLAECVAWIESRRHA